MTKLHLLFVLAILSVLGGSLTIVPEDKELLEDRYGWNRPSRPNRPGGRRFPVFPCQFPGQFPRQCPLQPTSPVPTTVSTPNANEATTQSILTRDCIRTCPVTSEYNPVCGSNNVTYDNPGRLYCARACGVNVHLLRSSPCSLQPTTPAPTTVSTPNVNEATTQSILTRDCIRTCPVTSEYNPVCGSNNVTYDNPGRLYCARACGVNVHLLRSSPCPSPTTVAPIA